VKLRASPAQLTHQARENGVFVIALLAIPALALAAQFAGYALADRVCQAGWPYAVLHVPPALGLAALAAIVLLSRPERRAGNREPSFAADEIVAYDEGVAAEPRAERPIARPVLIGIAALSGLFIAAFWLPVFFGIGCHQ
jgi:hypothetical protein